MSIVLCNVAKNFSGKRVINDVNLTISEGEFFAIVGASGCGKSTLLRLIAGLEEIDDGEIHLLGRRVSARGFHMPPEQRSTGFVFQSYALWPHMDVRGNVAFPAEAAGLTRAEAALRADRHLVTVELGGMAERKPAELSGGQRQRVALARCLAQEARVILMDEPLANLDPHLRATMEEELTAFHRASGATTVYITHDQREAMAVADRMAVMADGRLLQVGTPTEIYERPANLEVARFIGQGAIQPVQIRGGLATLAGRPVALSSCSVKDGLRHALFRPSDLAVANDAEKNALLGRVVSALYRGGVWEAKLAVPDLPDPFIVHVGHPVQAGDPLALTVKGGWMLPD